MWQTVRNPSTKKSARFVYVMCCILAQPGVPPNLVGKAFVDWLDSEHCPIPADTKAMAKAEACNIRGAFPIGFLAMKKLIDDMLEKYFGAVSKMSIPQMEATLMEILRGYFKGVNTAQAQRTIECLKRKDIKHTGPVLQDDEDLDVQNPRTLLLPLTLMAIYKAIPHHHPVYWAPLPLLEQGQPELSVGSSQAPSDFSFSHATDKRSLHPVIVQQGLARLAFGKESDTDMGSNQMQMGSDKAVVAPRNDDVHVKGPASLLTRDNDRLGLASQNEAEPMDIDNFDFCSFPPRTARRHSAGPASSSDAPKVYKGRVTKK